MDQVPEILAGLVEEPLLGRRVALLFADCDKYMAASHEHLWMNQHAHLHSADFLRPAAEVHAQYCPKDYDLRTGALAYLFEQHPEAFALDLLLAPAWDAPEIKRTYQRILQLIGKAHETIAWLLVMRGHYDPSAVSLEWVADWEASAAESLHKAQEFGVPALDVAETLAVIRAELKARLGPTRIEQIQSRSHAS